MNNTIIPTNTQEKSVFLFGNEEIYNNLLNAGISKSDISYDFSEEMYVKIEHLPIVEKISLVYEQVPQILDISFEQVKKETTVAFLQSKKASLLSHYGQHINEYVSVDKALSVINNKPVDNELHYEPIGSICDSLENRLKETRAKDILGLDLKFIESINSHMFGLRGIIALVAAPNCGKTVLVGQCITDVLNNNPDTCAVFISLEMEKMQIAERMVRAQAHLTYKEMNLKPIPGKEPEITHAIRQAVDKVKSFGDRLVILGKEDCKVIDSNKVITLVNKVKAKSGCSRVILVIDYLQVWPIDYDQIKTKTDLEADKWLMAQMQILKEMFIDDPVIIICEARKSAAGVVNKLTLADISGSARLGYGFEAAMSLNPYADDDQLFKLGKKLLGDKIKFVKPKSSNADTLVTILKDFLYAYGFAFLDLEMLKIREGDRFIELMVLDYRRNIFFSAKTKNDPRLAELISDLSFKYDMEKEEIEQPEKEKTKEKYKKLD